MPEYYRHEDGPVEIQDKAEELAKAMVGNIQLLAQSLKALSDIGYHFEAETVIQQLQGMGVRFVSDLLMDEWERRGLVKKEVDP